MPQRNGVIYDLNKGHYDKDNDNDTSINFEIETIKSSRCSNSESDILITGDIMVTGAGADTNVAFKNCAPF